ncbi:MAG: hypothetical protein ACI9HK_002444, partial [Pirellulaceae bacterium]
FNGSLPDMLAISVLPVVLAKRASTTGVDSYTLHDLHVSHVTIAVNDT